MCGIKIARGTAGKLRPSSCFVPGRFSIFIPPGAQLVYCVIKIIALVFILGRRAANDCDFHHASERYMLTLCVAPFRPQDRGFLSLPLRAVYIRIASNSRPRQVEGHAGDGPIYIAERTS
jgi:hypothetical protein